MNLTFIAVYAPTLNAKDSFYDELQDAGDVLIVAVDWDARLGPVDVATLYILGKFALGPRCASDDSLVNFASANRLIVLALASNTHMGSWSQPLRGGPDNLPSKG